MNYVHAFVLLILPVTFYVSIFARQVAEFLLGKEFRQGFRDDPLDCDQFIFIWTHPV